MDDDKLIGEYLQNRSTDAFQQLVNRHLTMVYSAALRMVRDPHLAEDVSQSVFTTLAEKASSLKGNQSVGGWLYNTTRHHALHVIRSEQRRRKREETAAIMHSLESRSDSARIQDDLEEAMARLEATDRESLVLRFLENLTLREVGQSLGITEDAARMRVNRALERLRAIFARRGLDVASVALAAALSSSGISALPVGLATTITNIALAGAVTGTATTTVMTVMNWINLKTASTMAAAAIIAGTGMHWSQQRKVDQVLEDQKLALKRVETLDAENKSALEKIREWEERNEDSQKVTSELMRLRNEVGHLRKQARLASVESKHPSDATVPENRVKEVVQPGNYVTKEALAYAGYDTPEAALQSTTWALITGDFEEAMEAQAPELRSQETDEKEERENFEAGHKIVSPLFKGMQIISRKVLSPERVELKVKFDYLPEMTELNKNLPEFYVQPLARVENQWKISGSTRDFQNEKWQDGSEIVEFSP